MEKQVVRIGPLGKFIASGVRSGNVITLSGQVAADAKGEVVGAGDITAQVRQAYANIVEVLDAFGATVADVVDETWFVTDLQDVMTNLRTVFGVRDEVYGGEYDVTQTMVEVSGLVYPELLVEIKCVAVVDSASEWQRDVVATRTSDDAS